MALPSFFTEDADFEETATIGSFSDVNRANTFDEIYQEACERYSRNWTENFNSGFLKNESLTNPAKVAGFKTDLLGTLQEDVDSYCAKPEFLESGCGNAASLYDQVSTLYDNKIDDLIEESANVGQLLPIKSIDIPVMVKNHIQLSFKDVVNEEITSNVVIKKRIEHSIAYDKKDPSKTWEYPQCFYDDSFKEMMLAGKGVELSTAAVPLPLFNYNIVEELTDTPISANSRIVIDLKIDKVEVADGTVITLRTPMTVNLADGAWIGGIIEQEYTNQSSEKKVLKDVLSGFTDWATNTTNLNSSNTTDGVTKVHFSGRLSNEGNEHAIRTRYIQEDKEWKVGENTKVEASYTLEELQEHKAMMNMDLYQKSYNDLVMLLSNMEDSDGYDWLDREFKKYDGMELDPLQWNPLVMKTKFNCDSTISTVATQSEYITKELKFLIDRFLIDIADTVKLDGLSFVVYGNPRYISLLEPFVHWVFRTGNTVGGVKLDYSYGLMTSGEVKIYVVSSKKINAKTHKTLRFIPFTDNKQTITFKRYKFSTDVVTSKESAYKDSERAGGSMTYVWGTSRYADVALQAIQGEVGFDNANFITTIPW